MEGNVTKLGPSGIERGDSSIKGVANTPTSTQTPLGVMVLSTRLNNMLEGGTFRLSSVVRLRDAKVEAKRICDNGCMLGILYHGQKHEVVGKLNYLEDRDKNEVDNEERIFKEGD